MAALLYESGAKEEKKSGKTQTSIVSGVVTNNLDLIMQGKVLVHLPSLGQEVWARLVAPGAGNGRGFFRPPKIKDEVLVALNDNEPQDAFIIGGLWSTMDSPPISLPTDAETKQIIKTGMTAAAGHEVEFDDLKQTITIQTKAAGTAVQKIVMDAVGGIEISTMAGTLKIKLDMAGAPPSITLSAMGDIKLSAAGKISLDGTIVDIQAKTLCKIQGPMVNIN